ncbi:MAG: HAD-IC family P-type ATPase [Gammaproteobacteria bacterium]
MQIVLVSNITENDALGVAASLERGSEHPVASALIHAADLRHLALSDVDDFRIYPGMGVSGTVAGKSSVLGNLALLRSKGLDITNLQLKTDALGGRSGSFVYLTVDGQAAAVFFISDPIRTDARNIVAELRASGLHITMITGDNPQTAAAVAGELGIDNFKASVLPQQKLDEVTALQRNGHRVAMVGDGINDAPALSQANVGIAMATGTDVAMQNAGITLVSGDLGGILRARKLSQHTLRNIKQNLFFAFVYNLLGVPVAAGVLYPFTGMLLSPMLAAATMSLSSICVITNALRLQQLKL